MGCTENLTSIHYLVIDAADRAVMALQLKLYSRTHVEHEASKDAMLLKRSSVNEQSLRHKEDSVDDGLAYR